MYVFNFSIDFWTILPLLMRSIGYCIFLFYWVFQILIFVFWAPNCFSLRTLEFSKSLKIPAFLSRVDIIKSLTLSISIINNTYSLIVSYKDALKAHSTLKGPKMPCVLSCLLIVLLLIIKSASSNTPFIIMFVLSLRPETKPSYLSKWCV